MLRFLMHVWGQSCSHISHVRLLLTFAQADVLNGALLLACGLPQHAALETIVRHTTAVRSR